MSKDFRPWKIDEAQLLPPSVQDYVAKDHLSRLIVALVSESLIFRRLHGSYRSALGQPPFDPRLMTALLLHGYASGIYSSRRIAKAAVERADFMMIVAGDPPDFRTISEFRRRHLKALAGLFVQVLKLAEKAGSGEARARGARRHQDQGERVEAQSDELRAHEEAGSGACRPRSTAGSKPPRRPMRRRTSSTATSAATRCPTGWPTSRSGWRRSARPRPSWRRKPKPPPRKRRGGAHEAEDKRIAEGRKKSGKTPAPPTAEPDGKAQRNFTDPREPHPEDQGRLHPGLQCAGRVSFGVKFDPRWSGPLEADGSELRN